MAEVVIKIPKDLEQEFGGVKSIFWQLAVGRVINEELERLRRLKQIVSKSKFILLPFYLIKNGGKNI